MWVSVVIVATLLLSGCETPPKPSRTEETIYVTSQLSENDNLVTSNAPPYSIDLQLASAPKVGETAELTTLIRLNFLESIPLKVKRVWFSFMWKNTIGSYQEYLRFVEVPAEEVLLGSTVDWAGELTYNKPLDFKIPIKLPKTGIWEITGFAEMGDGTTIHDTLELATDVNKAGIYTSIAYNSGQLEWMKDYCTIYGEAGGRLGYQLDTYIDMPHPPELGKPIELNWSVVSGYDTGTVNVQINCYQYAFGQIGGQKVSLDTVLVEGKLQWKGVLKKGIPVSGVVTVVFPEDGDWEICITCIDEKINSLGNSGISLSVNKEYSRWGWAESHEPPPDPNAPNPPPAPYPYPFK